MLAESSGLYLLIASMVLFKVLEDQTLFTLKTLVQGWFFFETDGCVSVEATSVMECILSLDANKPQGTHP